MNHFDIMSQDPIADFTAFFEGIEKPENTGNIQFR
jgi:hypothetical protein